MRNCRYFILSGLLLPALLLTGCGASTDKDTKSVAETAGATASNQASAETSSAKASSVSPEPWTEVQDGTWDYGDVELGQGVTQRLSDYEITVQGLPVLTTLDGKKVRMESELSVKRLGDDHDEKEITESEKVFFTPGNLNYPEHDEVYGIYPNFSCDQEQISVGQSTTCRVSFEAPAAEIQDSYWVINGLDAAAWPGQKVED